jgi:hypothetical protein
LAIEPDAVGAVVVVAGATVVAAGAAVVAGTAVSSSDEQAAARIARVRPPTAMADHLRRRGWSWTVR